MDQNIVNSTTLNQDNTKIIAMLALGGGSLIFGLLPALITNTGRRRNPLMISNLLCFGAGVLLATSLVHMLPEVRETLPKYAELIFCGGFFLVYISDELLHLIFGEAIRHTHEGSHTNHSHNHDRRYRTGASNNYGTMSESEALLGEGARPQNKNLDANTTQHSDDSQVIRDTEDRADAEANERICHTAHREPCEQSLAGHAGLLFALSLHSLLEGLAIGVQDSSTKVLLLLAAVACHKFVVGFCLGVELCNTPGSNFRNHLIAILIFSFGSIFGIAFGMGIVDVKNVADGPAVNWLQAIAAGTLLYVTVCEVLPREKARWHLDPRKYAGLSQCVSVIIGFTVMTLLTIFLHG